MPWVGNLIHRMPSLALGSPPSIVRSAACQPPGIPPKHTPTTEWTRSFTALAIVTESAFTIGCALKVARFRMNG
ncbi:hypothetical protein B0H67DRAFT_586196 [Lasiosphaeris hirsuta]|uniref:Uncharacterized protein n=1 Tax=Lasiosphaeris hirsuta TaxID=260670 RepID=A0AA40DPX1_9PEZI|nr:hypothetical protein B0H67DRAFT_586196 [Lasiosphaeris hirsuta]